MNWNATLFPIFDSMSPKLINVQAPSWTLLMLELIPLLRNDPNGVTLLNDVVKPSLNRLKDDSDGDVRYFANEAISCF